MASTSANIQGHILEVKVNEGVKLKNTANVGKQDPYVELKYGETNYKTKPCKGGGTNPTFNDKFFIELVQGLREIKISVCNRNTLSKDDFIGEGTVSLGEVLQKGYHDATCLIYYNEWSAGEISLTMIYPNAQMSYEHMRAAKEKTERELISYQDRSELELEKMKVKIAENEEELIGLRSELRNVGKQKQIVYEDGMQQSTLVKIRAELAAKDAKIHDLVKKNKSFQKSALYEVKAANSKLENSVTSLEELRYIKDDEIHKLKEELEAKSNESDIHELAQKQLSLQNGVLKKELDNAKKELEESLGFAQKAKEANEKFVTINLAVKRLQDENKKLKDDALCALKNKTGAGSQASNLKMMQRLSEKDQDLASLKEQLNEQATNVMFYKSELEAKNGELGALRKEYNRCRTIKLDLETALKEKEMFKRQLGDAMRGAMHMIKHVESSMAVSEELKVELKDSMSQLKSMSENVEESSSYFDPHYYSVVLPSNDDDSD